MHRLSPCSPLGAAWNQGKPSVDDVLRRDDVRLRSLFGDDSNAAAGSAPTPASDVTVPTTGTPLGIYPGAFEYHVVAGYGTPVQKFTVGFDTATIGTTLLQCKPCAAGEPCDQAFDPSQSSSLAQVPCGSPDCPLSACSGPSCTFTMSRNGILLFNATYVTDTLTLSQSTTVENFRFACLEMGARTIDNSSGILDLSRDRHSLASRAPSSPDTVAFSYCLPSHTTTQGFLSIGATRPERSGHNVSYATLRSNAARPNLYFVQLVGLGLGGLDLPIPPSTLAGDSLIELHATFTYLKPDVYAALRDQFRKEMSQYRVAPPSGRLDTCYDFTGLKIYFVPVITLKFDGGVSLDLDIEHMLYFQDRENPFSVGCLAFAAVPANAPTAAVIGTLAQASTEVVYDVRGGKVGFIPYRC